MLCKNFFYAETVADGGSGLQIYQFLGVGIEEIASPLSRNHLFVYPNPARAYFTIRLPQTAESRTLKIFDVAGKLIRVEELKGSKVKEFKVSLKGMKPGVYILQFGKITKKLLIAR